MDSQITATRRPNSAADTAWAGTVYSMVPYLGILFVPFALVASAVGFARAAASEDRHRFLLCTATSLFILAAQLVLWWLLYLIPERGL